MKRNRKRGEIERIEVNKMINTKMREEKKSGRKKKNVVVSVRLRKA